jgi:hypothetical protein
MTAYDPPHDPYEPDMIQVFRFEAHDGLPERWSWDVTFVSPHEGLNQEGYEPSLTKALLQVSLVIMNAQDARRADLEAGCE